MNLFKKSLVLILLLFLIFGISSVSANDDLNDTLSFDSDVREITDSSQGNLQSIDNEKIVDSDELQESGDASVDEVQSDDDEIIVNNWEELQYYCSLYDKDYTLRLKENTNYYPSEIHNINQQIIFNNNVKIIGNEGAYFGESAPDENYIDNENYISYMPMVVPDGNGVGITLENITFKWIYTVYNPDGVFLQMGGNAKNVIKNCVFENIKTNLGHSSIVYLKKGDATLENCSFVNCTTDFGCVSVYDPKAFKTARMIVKDCYFENNYARTEPGCINNCGVLTVYNSTFYKNRASVWAGAIHTHYSANTTVYDSNFTDNVAGWNGGAIYTYSYLQIYNTIFSGNNCTTNNGGGAIGACKHVSEPHIYVVNSLFENNENLCWSLDDLSTEGTGRGGAISLMDGGSIEVRNTTFISNAASIGTAICAIEAGSYGSPDVIIVNNTFINHTRAGDVLHVRVAGTLCEIKDNVYKGNSIEFSNLNLTAINIGKEFSTLKITAKLAHESYYDSDILDKTLYDVYVNGKYVKSVNSTVFDLEFGDLDICNVYVIPSVSNQKTNEVTLTSTREYIFVSKSLGSDDNDGLSRQTPVKSIKKALDLGSDYGNILILDGTFSEENLNVNYNVVIKGENNVILTNKTSFTVNNLNFTLKNIMLNNLNAPFFIKESKGNLVIDNCIIENNCADVIFISDSLDVSKSLIINNNALIVDNSGRVNIEKSILLNNSEFISGNKNNVNLDYNWWGNTLDNIHDSPLNGLNNWVFLNVTSNFNQLEKNQVSKVQFGFYLIENNNSVKYNNLPLINLNLDSINGILSNRVSSSDSEVEYRLTSSNDGFLIVNYNDVSYEVKFEFIKSNPNVLIKTEDVMVGDDVIIQISTLNDVRGNLTVNVGNNSQTKSIGGAITEFRFIGLKADDYSVVVSYSGDDNYLSQLKESKIIVNKYESTTKLNIGLIEVDEDLLLTIIASDGATGNILLSINDENYTVSLNDSVAHYTMQNVARGDYLIKALYLGDDNYLSSFDSCKIEVDNLDSSMSVSVENITYGETVTVKVILNDNATGIVSVTIDGITNSSEINEGSAIILLNGIDAGVDKKVIVFYTGDDTYFNKTQSASFTIDKADLHFDISSRDIKIGQSAVIQIIVPPKTGGNFTINGDVINIPMSGIVSYVLSDLEIGEYEITAIYNGNNYNAVMNSTSFNVLEYPDPQWPNCGGNTENTGKSNYESNANGEISFIVDVDGNIIDDIVIDSEGNIYVFTNEIIYSFDNNGNQRWIYAPESLTGNFTGGVIGRDVIVTPRAGDTLYFINQNEGVKYGSSNIYQASSLFTPVIDENANIYVVSEYQVSSGSYNIVVVPYKSWERGGHINLVSLGKNAPIASPVVNEDIIVVLCEGRLRVYDAKTLKSIFIKSGNYASVRPVIGEGNVVYAIMDDSLVAFSPSGSQIWKTKISGGAGNHLVFDNDLGVYCVNSKGNLYNYDIGGKESLVSTLNITSGVLMDLRSNFYFASDETFYAIDYMGNILWKSYIGSSVRGTPVMDENGVIYVTSNDNKVYAINFADLKDVNLNVKLEDNFVVITLDNQATGFVSFNIGGLNYTEEIDNGQVKKLISDLPVGRYSLDVLYSGDMRFKGANKSINGTIKPNVVMSVEDSNSDSVSINLPSDASGYLTVIVDGKSFTHPVVKGKASIKNLNLTEGNYDVVIVYSGDDKYASFTKESSISFVNPKLTGSNINMLYTAGNLYRVCLTQDGKALAGKTITFTLNNKKFTAITDKNGYASVKITLAPKTYSVTAQYSNVKISNKIVVKSIISAKNLKVKKSAKSLKIKITLKKVNKKYLKGKKVTLKFNGKTYKVKTNKKGVATFSIKKNVLKKLKVGKKYAYKVTYIKNTVSKKITVKK